MTQSYSVGRSREILAAIPGVVWEAWGRPDAATQRIDFVSDYVEEMLGYSVDEWLSIPNFWLSIVHPDDRDRAAAEGAAIFASGKPGKSAFRWLRKDGRVLWAQAHSTVLFDDDGNPAGMAGVTFDVTAEFQAQQRLIVRDNVLRIVAESKGLEEAAPRVLELLCKHLGWEMGALWRPDFFGVGLHPIEIWRSPAAFEAFEAATRGKTFMRGEGLPGRVWESGEATWIPDVRDDPNFPRVRAAVESGVRAAFAFPIVLGTTVLGVAEFFSRDVRETDAELLDLAGTIGQQLGLFIQKSAVDEALLEAELRRSEIVRRALDAVITMDTQGIIRDWNPQAAATFGWAEDEAIGKRLSDLILPERHRRAHEEGLRRFLATGEGPVLNNRIEIEGLHRSGREFPVELAISSVKVGEGYIFSGFVRDITERRRREAMRDDFVSFASHELRNPLTTVKGFAGWLENRVKRAPDDFDADTREAIEMLSSEAERMETIIEIFLDLARIESDHLELEYDRTDLCEVVRSEVDRLKVRYPEAQVACDVPGRLPIITDTARCRQVVANLLDNAAKYGGETPMINVRIEPHHSIAGVRVRDNGNGIPEADRAHIFERFYRGRDAVASRKKGLGIGLFLTNEIASRLGGHLTFESEEGVGTEFVFTLPLRPPDEESGDETLDG